MTEEIKREPMKTYEEVAAYYDLNGIIRDIYLKYMKIRWGHKAEEQCISGYAGEWAMRFRKGIEFGKSDAEGQQLLKQLCDLYNRVGQEE